MIIDIIRVENGLVLQRDSYLGGPTAFFSNAADWTFVVKNILFIVQTLLGDGVVVDTRAPSYLLLPLTLTNNILDISLLRCMEVLQNHCLVMLYVARYLG